MNKELNIRQYILKFGMVYMIGIITMSAIFVIFNLSHSAPASRAPLKIPKKSESAQPEKRFQSIFYIFLSIN